MFSWVFWTGTLSVRVRVGWSKQVVAGSGLEAPKSVGEESRLGKEKREVEGKRERERKKKEKKEEKRKREEKGFSGLFKFQNSNLYPFRIFEFQPRFL